MNKGRETTMSLSQKEWRKTAGYKQAAILIHRTTICDITSVPIS